MTIETELVAFLEADGGVSALVGTNICPVKLPQNPAMPHITYARIAGPRLRNLAGPAGRAMPRFSIQCWGGTAAQARAVADAVRAALDGVNGTLTTIKAVISIETDLDDYEDAADLYRVIQDYKISHEE